MTSVVEEEKVKTISVVKPSVFAKLVGSGTIKDENLIGIIAYCYYKKGKTELACSLHNDGCTQEEIDKRLNEFTSNCLSTNDILAGYTNLAEKTLVAYTTKVVEEGVSKAIKKVYTEIESDVREKLLKEYEKKLEKNTSKGITLFINKVKKNDPSRNSFWGKVWDAIVSKAVEALIGGIIVMLIFWYGYYKSSADDRAKYSDRAGDSAKTMVTDMFKK